jgi:hypothetical protein
MKQFRVMILAGLTLTAAGCGQDVDILARVGRKLIDKTEAFGRDAAGQWGPRLEAIRAGMPEDTLAARVGCRLHWDQTLASIEIQVQANENTVELTGTVADPDQRRRAVELAQSTLGVAKVIDSLVVPEPAP